MSKKQNSTSIMDYLPGNYQAPWGTKLAPVNFRHYAGTPPLPRDVFDGTKLVGYWTVAARDAAGNEVTYTIGQPKNARKAAPLWADGVETKPLDYITQQHRLMPVAATIDWLLRQDAQQHLTQSQPEWGANSIDAMLRRAEFGISSYAREERNLADFANISEFQAWLDNELASTTTKAEAFAFAPVITGDVAAVGLFTRHWHPGHHCHLHGVMGENQVETKQSEYSFNPTGEAADFYGQGEGRVITPELSVSRDGSQVESYRAENAFELAELEGRGPSSSVVWAATNGTRDNDTSENCDGAAWWGIAIRDIGLAIAFPRVGTNLLLATDRDGADVTISAKATTRRARINYLVDQFERDWGKWVDPSASLSATEIAAGVKAAEAMVVQNTGGPALTKQLIDEWLAIKSATVPVDEAPQLIPINDSTSLLVVGSNGALVNSRQWPVGDYTLTEDKQVTMAPLGYQGKLNQKSTEKLFKMMTQDFSKYLKLGNYHLLEVDDLPDGEFIERLQQWVNGQPDPLNLQLTPILHIANKQSKVFRAKGWFTTPVKLVETNRFTEYLDKWYDGLTNKAPMKNSLFATLSTYAQNLA